MPPKLVILMCQLCAFLFTGAVAAERAISADDLQRGDMVVVAVDSTRLMVGNRTLRLLGKGVATKVISVQDGWVLVEIETDSDPVRGWVRDNNLSRVTSAAGKSSPANDTSRNGTSKKSAVDRSQGQKSDKETLADRFRQMLAEKERELTGSPAKQSVKTATADSGSKSPALQQAKTSIVGRSNMRKQNDVSDRVETDKIDTKVAAPPSQDESLARQVPPVQRKIPSEIIDEAKPLTSRETTTETAVNDVPRQEEANAFPEDLAEKLAQIVAERRRKASESEASGLSTPSGEEVTADVLMLRTAADFAGLSGQQRINQLIVTGDHISNRSLRSLAGFYVASLSIEAVNVSNTGLQYVAEIDGIRQLRLWSPGIDDGAFRFLAELSDLELLDVEGTAMKGESFSALKDLPKLRWLILGPKVSDEAIAELQQLPALRRLDLRACRALSSDCLKSLVRLNALEAIWLPDQLGVQGKSTLRSALPDCQVRS
jgi:hypothetical protein